MAEYFRIPYNITSFTQIDIPKNVTHIYCYMHNFTSFIGCPDHITHIICSNNQITSFEFLPDSIQELLLNFYQIQYKNYFVIIIK
jgi:hypothetical protein